MGDRLILDTRIVCLQLDILFAEIFQNNWVMTFVTGKWRRSLGFHELHRTHATP